MYDEQKEGGGGEGVTRNTCNNSTAVTTAATATTATATLVIALATGPTKSRIM